MSNFNNTHNALHSGHYKVSPDAFVPVQSTQKRYEVIQRENPNFGFDPGASIKNMFEKLIVPAEGEKVRKFSLNLTEAEIKRIQNLYDFLNSDSRTLNMSLDDFLRQILLQPEMHFKICNFFGYQDSGAVEHVIINSPESFGWF